MSYPRISDLSVCFPTGGIVKAVDGIDLNVGVRGTLRRIRTGFEKTAGYIDHAPDSIFHPNRGKNNIQRKRSSIPE